MPDQTPMTPDSVIAVLFLILTLISAVVVGLLRLYDVIIRWMSGRQTPSYNTPNDNNIQEQAPSHPTPVAVTSSPAVMPLSPLEPEQRLHTIIAGRSGDGKTQASISMMVADIARGYQVFWLSPDLALYHPKDQPTDLRPLRQHFSFHADVEQIVRVLATIIETVNQRQALYTQGKDVGHPICLYLDEWPAIVAEADKAEALLGTILRRGRRANIWVVLATQDAQVETMKLHGGLRAAFQTRLVGNVDRATWLSLIGKDEKQVPMQKGFWYAAGQVEGVVQVERPSAHTIAKMAQRPPIQFATTASLTENVLDFPQPAVSNGWTEAHVKVAFWLSKNPDISQSEVARRLWPHSTGKGSYNQKAKKLMEEVTALLEEQMEEVPAL